MREMQIKTAMNVELPYITKKAQENMMVRLWECKIFKYSHYGKQYGGSSKHRSSI
jgi:hypothetical protein